MSSKATEALDLGIRNDAARLKYWTDRAASQANKAREDCRVEWDVVAAAHLADELRDTFRAEVASMDMDELWRELLCAALDQVEWLDVAKELLDFT